METNMHADLSGIKRRIYDVQTNTAEISKRLNDMASTSGCNGELCDCFTSNKKVQAQTDLLNRKVSELETKLVQTEQIVIQRETRINALEKQVNDIYNHNEEMQSQMKELFAQIERGKLNSGRAEREHASQKENVAVVYRRDQLESKTTDTDPNVTRGNRRANVLPSVNKDLRGEHVNRESESIDKVSTPKDDEEAKHITIAKSSASNIQTSRSNFVRSSPKGTETEIRNSKELALRAEAQEPGTINTQEIVNRQSKEYYRSERVWEVEAQAELNEAIGTPLRKLSGAKTVLLVDTSSSMLNGDGWKQAQTFVHDYIAGLQEIGPQVGNHEHVALVTFGAQTKCQQRFTNDMHLIKSTFDKLVLGGPSPLFGGLVMAHAVAVTPEDDGFDLENGMLVSTKMILITDGEPTEMTLHSGPDEADASQIGMTKENIIKSLEIIQLRPIDVFCVPVGNVETSNREFLNLAFSKEGSRRMLSYRDGHYFSRRLYLSMQAVPTVNLFSGNTFAPPRDDRGISASDHAQIWEIIEDDRKKKLEANQRKEENPYQETKNEGLLQLGTRVRRGPDWVSGDQDGKGPGTVVGHHLYADKLWIHWDVNREIQLHDFGCMDKYSVFPVNEPRIPLPGQPIDVGCVVCPGNDWSSEEKTSHTRGVVLQISLMKSGTRKAVVRWDNGERGAYSYGYDGKYEIQVRLSDLGGEQSYQSLPVARESDQASGSTIQQRIPNYIEGHHASSRTATIQRPQAAPRPAENSTQLPRANKNKNS